MLSTESTKVQKVQKKSGKDGPLCKVTQNQAIYACNMQYDSTHYTLYFCTVLLGTGTVLPKDHVVGPIVRLGFTNLTSAPTSQ